MPRLRTVATARAEIDRPAPSSPARLPVEALTFTAPVAEAEQAGDRRAHVVQPGAEPRPGADDRRRRRSPAAARARRAARRPRRRSSSLSTPRGVAGVGREQAAEVAEAGGPEQRVGDGVERDVAVRVAGEARRAVDLDPAQAERRPGTERMAVVAEADARRRRAPAPARHGAGRRAGSP